MNTFIVVKHIHLLSVAIVGLLFLLRSYLLLTRSPTLQAGWLRMGPHLFSILLLASGLTLGALTGMQGWMLTKLVLLFVFIAIGVFTFKRASTRGAQLGGIVLGLLVYAFIISIAAIHNSAGFFWLYKNL